MAKRTPAAESHSPSNVSGSEFGDVAAELTRQRLPGIDQVAMALGFALVRTGTAHMQEIERRVHRPRGLSFSGFRILYMIWLFKEIEARDLARLAGVSRQTTSTVLANLESNGFVHRERTSETDRRLVAVRLTLEGEAMIGDVFTEQNRLESEWFDCLTPDERAQLKSLLDRVSARVTTTQATY